MMYISKLRLLVIVRHPLDAMFLSETILGTWSNISVHNLIDSLYCRRIWRCPRLVVSTSSLDLLTWERATS